MSSESYHHGNLREALLKAAQQQIEIEGAQALNLSKLARELGVSQPAVYRHFANKQSLIFSLVEQGFELLAQRVQGATESVKNTEEEQVLERLKAIAQAYVYFALEYRELARLMFSLKERATDPSLYKVSKQAASPLFQLVNMAQQRDQFAGDDVEEAVRLLWSTIHGLAVLLMDEQMPKVTQSEAIMRQVDATAQLLWKGLFVPTKDQVGE